MRAGNTGDDVRAINAGNTGDDVRAISASGIGGDVRVISGSDVGNDGHAVDAPAWDMPRPLWLLEAPVPLSVDLQPGRRGGVSLEEGPERIESGWWDGKGVARDYYVARVPGARPGRGARWWIFQERQSRSWYLHGVFA
jgi:hypothetical protein